MAASVVIGARGAIGAEFSRQLAMDSRVYAFARGELQSDSNIIYNTIDIADEASIQAAACKIQEPITKLIIATGILHDTTTLPEKNINSITALNLNKVFTVNSFGPILVLKYFLPHFKKDIPGVFAAISARVGSISDNRLGGWYSYRASKTALNMLLKTASVELKRTHPKLTVVGLHPGTVVSRLSAPFGNTKKKFTPKESVQQMLNLIEGFDSGQSGNCFAYDGSIIHP